MRKAIFGGTFNPIHYGHLRIAEEAREALSLDRVIFIPTSITPHKAGEILTSPEDRLEMVNISIKDNPGFEVSDIEIRRGGRSYTIDTVTELKEQGGAELRLSLIIGNDSFNDITTWCEFEKLFTLADFIIVPRPGYPVKKPGEVLPVELARKFWYDPKTGAFQNSYGNTLTYLNTTLMDISSSDIRSGIKEGRSVRYLLPDAATGYINKKGLYRS
ncbi:MAG: nicotinate-nucleotide adenylyltransferase [Deltaproteobacteria bacterium]|nr:nicotinate-nucleotide adenylyltransferase [Deltaproteobacteria bacterium]